MKYLEKLNKYLKENSDTAFYDVIRNLIKIRVSEMDNSVPKLLNKAFNHLYTISRIEKSKSEGEKGNPERIADFDAQIKGQFQQIWRIQAKISEMKEEYNELKKAMIAVCQLNNYQIEINSFSDVINNRSLDGDLQTISSKYLFNSEYEQKLIEGYKTGLEKEGLELWRIRSLEDIPQSFIG